MDSWITQLRKGLIELCVLNLLEQGESYGYEILQALQEIEELVVTDSTVYPILSRLRKDGCLKVQVKPSSSGPPPKTAASKYRSNPPPPGRRAAIFH